MNRKSSRILGLLMTSIMVASCFTGLVPVAGASHVAVMTTGSRADTEPNDDINHASAATSGQVTPGSLEITTATDYQDWYSFTCTRGQAINVSLYLVDYNVAIPSEHNLNIVLFGPQDDTFTMYTPKWLSFLETRWETASTLCVYSTTYFLWVLVNTTGAGAPNTQPTSYTLDITIYTPPALAGGQSDTKTLKMDSPNWFQWYKIASSKDQSVVVKATPPAQGQVDMDMIGIWNRGFDKSAGNESLQPYFLNRTSTTAVGQASQMVAMTGDLDIYVQLWLRKGTGITGTKFEVINAQIPSDNDNVPVDATEIKKTSAILSHIQQSVDHMDWYKFTIDSAYTADIIFSPQDIKTSYWNLTIWDANLDYVYGWFNTQSGNPYIAPITGPPPKPGNPISNNGVTLTKWQPKTTGTYYISIMGIAQDPKDHLLDAPLIDQNYRLYVQLPNFGPENKSQIPDAQINEDETFTGLDVSDYFTDKEGDPLTYAARIDTSKVALTLLFSNLTAKPVANWNGEANITVDATDGMANIGASTIHQYFKLTVLPVNDLPYVKDGFASFTMMENEQNRQTYPNKLTNVFGDIDSVLTYTWSGGTHIKVKEDTKTTDVFFSADDLWFGEENITFTAKDEGTTPAKVTVNIKIAHRNHEPNWVGKNTYTVNMEENDEADTSLKASDMFTDIDGSYAGDKLTYRLRDPLPLHLNITILQDQTISILPEMYWSGDTEFRVYCQDISGAENETRVIVKVAHINQAPHIDVATPSKKDQTIKEGDTQTFMITAVTDVDNDTKYDIRYKWYVNNDPQEGANVKNQQFIFRSVYQPADGFAAGDYHIKCVISDGLLNDEIEWNLTVTDVNQPPTGAKITSPSATIQYEEGKPITFSSDVSNAKDPDGDTLYYKWVINSTGTTVSEQANFVFDYKDKVMAKQLNPGTHKIDFIVYDKRGGESKTSLILNVKAKPKKNQPGFEAPLLLVAVLVALVVLGRRRFKHV